MSHQTPDSAGHGDPVELPRLNEAVFFMSAPVQMIFASSVEGPGPAMVDPLAAQRAAYVAALEEELAELDGAWRHARKACPRRGSPVSAVVACPRHEHGGHVPRDYS